MIVASTHIFHGGKCFNVSTIERESSAPYGGRYNETIVWQYDWDKRERGEMLHQDEDRTGSIETHQRIVDRLYSTGELPHD